MPALKTGLVKTNLLLWGCFREGFITDSFCKWPLYTLEDAKCKYTCATLKHKKTYE